MTEKFRIHYAGNVELGHVFLWNHFLNNTSGIASVTTTHGAQVTPYLYAGAGAGTWFLYSKDGVGFLLTGFLDVRAILPTHRRFKPFIDVKVGFAGSYNTFVTPSIGYKYAWGKKGGVYLSLGLDLIFNEYNTAWDGLNVRLGFDF